MSQLFTWGGWSIGVSASASVLPMNTQDWSPLGWTGWISLQSKGLSRVFSNTIMVELKSLLMKVREWKSWLKTQHSKNKDYDNRSYHFMGNRWGNSGWLYFWGLQNHCRWWLTSCEIKRCLLLGRKALTNLDNILKSRDITLPTKFCLVKAMVFPVVTYGCESWTIKKAECRRIDAFEMWCWKRLLKVPWQQEDITSPS